MRRLGELAATSGTPIYAWALISNHVHILLSSGVLGLAPFMRRLLTGYAVNYNLRHRRHGHLFQNRYKSMVCDEDSYFTELVRYIHLKPGEGARPRFLNKSSMTQYLQAPAMTPGKPQPEFYIV